MKLNDAKNSTLLVELMFSPKFFSKGEFFRINLVAHQGKYDVQIENVTEDLGVLSVAGPYAGHVFGKALQDQDLVDNWKFLDAKVGSL